MVSTDEGSNKSHSRMKQRENFDEVKVLVPRLDSKYKFNSELLEEQRKEPGT
jgi:hypothetical protein